MRILICGYSLLALVILATGCQAPNPKKEPFGKTYYLDGAGNLGYGTAEVPRGLQKAGYRGDPEVYIWTSSLNPLIDQLNILGAARSAGRRLARKIKDYKRRYPDNQINIIALSAGTGVAVWACENLDEDSRVDNLVLLGSSLSYNYDMSKALPNIKNKVYVYHSRHDAILSTVEIVGTIDRKMGIKSAGQVGLQPPKGGNGKIVNTPWSQEWRELGWAGGHTDCTNEKFVQHEIAKRILAPQTTRSEVKMAQRRLASRQYSRPSFAHEYARSVICHEDTKPPR